MKAYKVIKIIWCKTITENISIKKVVIKYYTGIIVTGVFSFWNFIGDLRQN